MPCDKQWKDLHEDHVFHEKICDTHLVQTGLDPGVYYTSGKNTMHSVKQGSLSHFMKNKTWAVSSFELGRTDYTFTFSNCAEIVALLCMLTKFLYNAWAEMVRPYI